MFTKVLRYILLALAGVVALVLCGYGFHTSEKARSGITCNQLNVILKDSTASFLNKEDIDEAINAGYGSFYGKKIDSLDLKKIEDAVCSHSAVKSGEVYVTLDSALNVVIKQKVPYMRFQRPDGGFYVDKEGEIFPLQKRHTINVPVVDGNIPDEVSPEWIAEMIALEEHIQKDKVWKNNIIQIHIDEKGDIVLIPREGSERFIFGGPEEYERKFKQMETYYTSIKPAKDSAYYRSVNVKFEKQIICRQ